MRRTPEGIITAHAMDPARRELYVEGRRDRVFLKWATPDMHVDATVVCIDDVELPASCDEDCSGGNRGRLLRFLADVEGRAPRIVGFVDRDQDHLLGIERDLGSNVVLTDFRDMESYVLFEENIDKMLRAGIGVEKVSAADFLKSAVDAASLLSAVRLISVRENLMLPVGGSRWENKLTVQGGLVVRVDLQGIVHQLLQNADISLRESSGVVARILLVAEELTQFSPQMRVHGKDMMRIIKLQLHSLGTDVSDASYVVNPTVNMATIGDCPAMRSILEFLRGEVVSDVV